MGGGNSLKHSPTISSRLGDRNGLTDDGGFLPEFAAAAAAAADDVRSVSNVGDLGRSPDPGKRKIRETQNAGPLRNREWMAVVIGVSLPL